MLSGFLLPRQGTWGRVVRVIAHGHEVNVNQWDLDPGSQVSNLEILPTMCGCIPLWNVFTQQWDALLRHTFGGLPWDLLKKFRSTLFFTISYLGNGFLSSSLLILKFRKVKNSKSPYDTSTENSPIGVFKYEMEMYFLIIHC